MASAVELASARVIVLAFAVMPNEGVMSWRLGSIDSVTTDEIVVQPWRMSGRSEFAFALELRFRVVSLVASGAVS